ncbi:MAG TPA: DUF3999 domain-containing protein [Usitatibacter sp.]|nr:DUF3999 domain-containing protein [Usitatibacter sp.]
MKARYLVAWAPVFTGVTLMVTGMTAFAEDPSGFKSTARIATTSSDALHRIALPFEAYRDAKTDFSDLRVFNAAGEALPIAFTGEPEAVKNEAPAAGLPMFPVSAAPQAKGRAPEGMDVYVKSGPNGTIVSVQGRPVGKLTPKPVAWLLDASQLTTPIRALDFQWDVGPGTEIVHVNVDASDDLKEWRRVSSHSQLVVLRQEGLSLEQHRVEVGSLKAKYLRITGDTAGFALKSVQAQSVLTVAPPTRLTRSFRASAGAKAGTFEIDLGARLPIDAMKVDVPANTVAPIAIATRETETGPWVPLTSATFYRMTRGGASVESPAVEIGRRSMRWVQLTLDSHVPSLGGDMPTLEVQWRPAQIVFVARGDAPFTLAFGNPEAKRTILALNQVVPDYKTGAEMKIPEDQVLRVATVTVVESPMTKLVGDVNKRKLVLWGALLIAVIVLGFMAVGLAKQMKKGDGGAAK